MLLNLKVGRNVINPDSLTNEQHTDHRYWHFLSLIVEEIKNDLDRITRDSDNMRSLSQWTSGPRHHGK